MKYKSKEELRKEYLREGGKLYTIETAPRTYVDDVDEYLRRNDFISEDEFIKRITSLID